MMIEEEKMRNEENDLAEQMMMTNEDESTG